MARPARDAEAGLTMVEIMISLLLVSIAAAFVFSIQMRTSTALRDQQAIAEMQQTLRSASDHLARDLRGAGYLARKVRVSKPGGSACVPDGVNLFEINGVGVVNSNAGPDLVRIVSADTSAGTAAAAGSFTPSTGVIDVDTVDPFEVGDTVLVAASNPSNTQKANFGIGCVLTVTAKDTTATTLSFAPGTGVNVGPDNCQCAHIPNTASGFTVSHVILRAYRISPSDARGVLQMSPTAGVSNDWVDMAVGIVDLQLALRVEQTGDTTDEDLDGKPLREWFSGDNMETALDASTNSLIAASVSLVAKTTKEVNGVLIPQTPDLFAADAGADWNRVGDRPGTPLPVTDTASMYYGDFVYRTYTATVDMRNMGVGL